MKTHLFGDNYAYKTHDGMMISQFYIKKEVDILPGVPMLTLTSDLLNRLMTELSNIQKCIYPDELIPRPCLRNRDTHHDDDLFIGCYRCMPFFDV